MPLVRHAARRTPGPATPSDRPRRRRLFSGDRDRQRGAALLEGAIVAPVFFMMICGMLDGAWMLFGDHVTRGSSSAGVRTASALAKDIDADRQALLTVRDNMDALPSGAVTRVVIYKANGFGDQPTLTCRNGTGQTGICNVYTAADLKRPATDFGCKSATALDGWWCPTTRKTAVRGVGSPPDYIGVWILARHTTLTGMVFPVSRTTTSYSVLRVEPRA